MMTLCFMNKKSCEKQIVLILAKAPSSINISSNALTLCCKRIS